MLLAGDDIMQKNYSYYQLNSVSHIAAICDWSKGRDMFIFSRRQDDRLGLGLKLASDLGSCDVILYIRLMSLLFTPGYDGTAQPLRPNSAQWQNWKQFPTAGKAFFQ